MRHKRRHFHPWKNRRKRRQREKPKRGKTDYSKIDIKAIAKNAMYRYGFQSQFPRHVMQEVNALNFERLLKDGEEDATEDLRSLLWSSIDNDDSLDLDQIEYCELGSNNEIHVKIAIADVDLFVPKKSRIDKHASHNGTSVYTGVETYPMLPDKLSADISSLRAGQERMAVAIEFTVLADGSMRKGNIYRTLVQNKAKLVYEVIGDWLEKKIPLPDSIKEIPGLKEQLLLQDEASQRLGKFRMDQGALELETLEPRPIVKGDLVKDLVLMEKNRARDIIENFMIGANLTMMNFLENRKIPVIQRVVRIPSNWDAIMAVAFEHGETLPSKPDPKALSQFLIRQKKADPERFPDLSLTIVKLLGAGEYVVLEPGKPPLGHFGLAVTDYTHGTAPNRRYIDVVIQRLLKSVLAEKPTPYNLRELTEISTWCTDRDKAANKVERFVRKAAAALLLIDRIGETFEGIVTGASEKGTYVRIITPPAEGRVLYGEKGMFVGQKVRVRLVGLDPCQGHIDFKGEGEYLKIKQIHR